MFCKNACHTNSNRKTQGKMSCSKRPLEDDFLKGEKRAKRGTESDDEFADLEDEVMFKSNELETTNSDMYLDSINRKILNFELPFECSSTLATTNVFVCLVCGKYLHGSSTSSPAYLHSVDSDHHIFISLESLKFILLPEQKVLSKERESELKDIQLLIDPKFDERMVEKFDKEPMQVETYLREQYTVGYIPILNKLSDLGLKVDNTAVSDNALFYALSHLSKFRDFFIKYNYSDTAPLSNQVSRLIRNIWSPYLFRGFTSSYAIENYLSTCKIPPRIRSDLKLFYMWITNTLIKENKSLKPIFTGKLTADSVDKKNLTTFLTLTLSMPQQSVFKDGTSSSIEQHDIETLITQRNFHIKKAPEILTIYIDRTNHMRIEGIDQELNMSIVKFDPDLLEVNNTFKYRLIGNITYENKVQILNKSQSKWMEFDGVSVKEVEKELLFINNCKLQFWELLI